MSSNLWSVAVDAPLNEPLTYQAPEELSNLLKRGQLVNVPLGKRHVKGLVLAPQKVRPDFEIKNIKDLDTEYQLLPDFFVKWLEWLAHYYVYPVGSVAALAYPPLKRTEKQRKSSRPPVVPIMENLKPPTLTDEQQTVFDGIKAHQNFSTHLIFGVTGSGKTEIYLRLLEETLARGKKGIVLVPEISLTPQLVQRFAGRFPDRVGVLHSQLTDRERTNQWWEMIEGNKSILIGARSALFCPIENLGMIIVDEEHESSFKQDEKLKYHGRDAAIMLAKFANCPVVLGSATPSLESWKNTMDGRYHLHVMEKRVENRALPDVEVVDLRIEPEERPHEDIPDWLSPKLFEALKVNFASGKQSALFLNRRGIAQVVLCRECGFTVECPNCDITLTLHGKSHLVCHYCDYHEDLKNSCPSCKEGELKPVGLGTEQVEEDMRRLFPDARVARADRDEIQSRTDLEELIEKMEKSEIDILVGTQMIAKGLDFPNLTVVGIVLADVGFNLPDFRSTERSFQLLTQVSGRAGRHVKPGESPGKVLIQTYNPDHPSLIYSQKTDFRGFAEYEMQSRAPLNYPPSGKLTAFRIQGTQHDRVLEGARLLAVRAQALKQHHANYEHIEVLGPAEAPIAKLRGQYRYHLLVKGTEFKFLNSFVHQLLGDQKWLPAAVRISVDVDPLHLL